MIGSIVVIITALFGTVPSRDMRERSTAVRRGRAHRQANAFVQRLPVT
jgi:hypothetical protein